MRLWRRLGQREERKRKRCFLALNADRIHRRRSIPSHDNLATTAFCSPILCCLTNQTKGEEGTRFKNGAKSAMSEENSSQKSYVHRPSPSFVLSLPPARNMMRVGREMEPSRCTFAPDSTRLGIIYHSATLSLSLSLSLSLTHSHSSSFLHCQIVLTTT